MRIGVLMPFSGEYPQIRRALLDSLKNLQTSHELVREFINQGKQTDVARALEKLLYHEDVDAVIGYVGYSVVTQSFDLIRKFPDKPFIHLSLGETIPMSYLKVNYPPNYYLVSANAWRSGAYLGDWVANSLNAQNCLICTSLFDSGYCFAEAFRIGYHSRTVKTLSSTILNNPPGVFDVRGLFANINQQRPEHLHIALCGRELIDFINLFSTFVDYAPSVSFAFPVFLKGIETSHESFRKTYNALSAKVYSEDLLHVLPVDPVERIFANLTSLGTEVISEMVYGYEPEDQLILEANLHDKTAVEITRGKLPASLNGAFNYSAENTTNPWQNPYLCV